MPDNTEETVVKMRQIIALLSAALMLGVSGLAIHALFGTAVTFHIVSIFADAGRSQSEAFAYFLPVSFSQKFR